MSRTPSQPAPLAVVLLSGGLDSATALAIARSEGFACHCLSFDYGQRHRFELAAAEVVAERLGAVRHRTVRIDLSAFGGSALTDAEIDVPIHRSEAEMAEGIPITYVPARNLVFLSLAAAYAETVGAHDLVLGVNAIDYSGYPDCRPDFIRSFERTVNLGTRAGAEGRPLRILAPLIDLTKAQIVRLGTRLGVDYALTHSCYGPDDTGRACGVCDACVLRRRGFEQADVPDPTDYAPGTAG